MDAIAEVPIRQILEMPKEERLQSKSHDILLKWIGTDFKNGLISELHQKEGNRHPEKLASLQGSLAAVIDIFSQDFAGTGQGLAIESLLDKALFSTAEKDSVVNGLPNSKDVVRDHLYGAFSIVTFIDLARKAGVAIRALDIIAPATMDVKGKVDLILKFGERDQEGKEIVRVIQLKSHSSVINPEIFRADDPNLDTHGQVGPEHVRTLLATVRQTHWIMGEQDTGNAVIRPFIVIVPGYASESVRNCYGRITNTNSIDTFVYDAKAYGLLPDKK